MALLSAQDRELVRQQLAPVAHPVTLLFFTQTIQAPESALVARQVLDELAGLNDLVTVEEVNFVLDRERAAAYGIPDIPAIVVLKNGVDARMRFLGAPAGYEFVSLVQAIVLAGTDDSGLTPENKSLVASVREPMDVKVFVTPTCPHCPRAVTLANRMAAENTAITATCVEATEFPSLAREYRVTGVPKTVANSIEILGALPEDEFIRSLIGGTPEPSSNT